MQSLRTHTSEECIRRREALAHLLPADDVPLEETAPADYVKVRNRRERGDDPDFERELLRSGQLTYADYRQMREAEEENK